MSADSQIFIPPSFIALYSDARGRLRGTPAELAARYELCEDLANHLVEQAQLLYHGAGAPSEGDILLGIHAGLAAPEAGFPDGQADWIVLRLAELLGWRAPALPGAAA